MPHQPKRSVYFGGDSIQGAGHGLILEELSYLVVILLPDLFDISEVKVAGEPSNVAISACARRQAFHAGFKELVHKV